LFVRCAIPQFSLNPSSNCTRTGRTIGADRMEAPAENGCLNLWIPANKTMPIAVVRIVGTPSGASNGASVKEKVPETDDKTFSLCSTSNALINSKKSYCPGATTPEFENVTG